MISLKKSSKLIMLISSFIIVFALGSCTTGNFGRLQSDREIMQAFKDFRLVSVISVVLSGILTALVIDDRLED